MTREELEAQITAAARGLVDAQAALTEWDARPENNVFATLEEAEGAIFDALQGQASDDCEGSYNCGDPEYTREFMVDGVVYVGTLRCEYNRHDKTYYYLEESTFTVAVKEPE